MGVGSLDLSEEKRALRERVLVRRDAIDPAERIQRSALVCARLSALLDEMLESGIARARTSEPRHGFASQRGLESTPFVVSVYAAMRSEVDLSAFAAHAFERGCFVAYPCMVKNPDWNPLRADQAIREGSFLPRNLMEFRLAFTPEDAQAAPFVNRPLRSFEQNSPELKPWPTVEPAKIDFAVCPLVAFESSGDRLGYGGGNYDRLLAEIWPRALVVGVAFEEQRVPDGTILKEPHDKRLPAVISA